MKHSVSKIISRSRSSWLSNFNCSEIPYGHERVITCTLVHHSTLCIFSVLLVLLSFYPPTILRRHEYPVVTNRIIYELECEPKLVYKPLRRCAAPTILAVFSQLRQGTSLGFRLQVLFEFKISAHSIHARLSIKDKIKKGHIYLLYGNQSAPCRECK